MNDTSLPKNAENTPLHVVLSVFFGPVIIDTLATTLYGLSENEARELSNDLIDIISQYRSRCP